MSQFTADDILNMQAEGEMATDFEPVPEGEFAATISKVDVRLVGTAKDKPVLDVTWKVQDSAVALALGIDEPQVRQTVFLDVTANGLDLSKGKNVQLGRLRAAVGQNGPGAWGTGMLIGSSAIVKVSHREYEGRIFAEVKGVAAA